MLLFTIVLLCIVLNFLFVKLTLSQVVVNGKLMNISFTSTSVARGESFDCGGIPEEGWGVGGTGGRGVTEELVQLANFLKLDWCGCIINLLEAAWACGGGGVVTFASDGALCNMVLLLIC